MMQAYIFICKTQCNRNGHHTLHLYSNYFSKDLKEPQQLLDSSLLHGCKMMLRGKDHSSHFIKEEADVPRGYELAKGIL